MSQENKALVRRLIDEVWNQGKLAMTDELVAPNFATHDPGSPDFGRGPQAVKQGVSLYRNAFPDIRFTIEDMVAEGDKVVTRWTASGTHKGELSGIPPTGKKTTVTGVTISRFAGGKIVETWSNWDTLGLMQQLGVAPAPGQVARR